MQTIKIWVVYYYLFSKPMLWRMFLRGENVYGVQWYGCAVRSCVGDGTVVQVYNAICTMNSKLYVRLYAQCGTKYANPYMLHNLHNINTIKLMGIPPIRLT